LLFLSKFLPLFIYPLGLITLLIAVSSYFAWRKRSWLQFPLILALFLLLLTGNRWISNALLASLERQNLPQYLPPAEAIVILGGGTYSAIAPRPMVEVSEAGDRILYGTKLYREGKAPWVVVTGGRITWLSQGQAEARDMENLLTFLGVPHEVIIEEPLALNTYENGLNVKKILEQRGIKQVLLVTSAYHMPRAKLIFQKLGIDFIPAPTDFRIEGGQDAQITMGTILINLIPNGDYLAQTTLALKEYLGLIFYAL
jgi:uncharacterized SAM-binding protein YcdF (DUF218 family)